MAADGGNMNNGVFDEFAARLRERRARAEEDGDQASVARYDAMEAVLGTKLVPLVCPDAVTLAGDAARAACEGREEGEWFQSVCRERERSGADRVALFKAVRLLKTVGIWPWAVSGRRGTAVTEGGRASGLAMPTGASHVDPEESAMGLEV